MGMVSNCMDGFEVDYCMGILHRAFLGVVCGINM